MLAQCIATAETKIYIIKILPFMICPIPIINYESTSAKSEENRFRILPLGFLSKNT
jgi:hypothetical protein